MDLDEFTEFEAEDLFYVEPLPTRSYEKDYAVQMDISVEMNLNLQIYEREGYKFMDVLSDVGGFLGLLASFCQAIVSFANYEHFSTYVASRLFKILPSRAKRRKAENDGYKIVSRPIHLTRCKNICNYFRDCFPSSSGCLKRRSEKYRAVQRAFNHLETETNIIQIVKSRRYFKLALKLLLKKEVRRKLKKECQYIEVGPSSSDNLSDSQFSQR